MTRGVRRLPRPAPDPHSVRDHEQVMHLDARAATRLLVDEPLTSDDWYAVHLAHRAFIFQVRLVVARARARAGMVPGVDPLPKGESENA